MRTWAVALNSFRCEMQSVNILGKKTNTKEEESKKSRGNERQQREWEREKKRSVTLAVGNGRDASYDLIACR